MRRQLSLKPGTYTERVHVDATGISVKVSAHYPGRSDDRWIFRKRIRKDVDLSHNPREDVRLRYQKSAEVIVVRMTNGRRTEQRVKTMKLLLMVKEGVAGADREDYQTQGGSTARKAGGKP